MPKGRSGANNKRGKPQKRNARERHEQLVRTRGPPASLFQKTPKEIHARVNRKIKSLREKEPNITAEEAFRVAANKILGNGFHGHLKRIRQLERTRNKPKQSIGQIIRGWMKTHGKYEH